MGRSSTTIFLLVTVISGAWGLCYPSCMDASNSSYVPEGTRVPNPSTCDEFFVCSDQGGDLGMGLSDEPLACPAGMYFDRSSASCQEIPDDGSIYCTPCNPCEVECTEPGAVAPNPYSCKDYYVCLQGGGYIEAECSDGNQFDFQSGECQLENVTRCFEACNKCEVYCVEEGRIPDPFDCNAYLYCEPGVGTAHFLCAEGYYYNSETQECDEEDDSNLCTDLCPSDTTVSSDSPATATATTPSITDAPSNAPPANFTT